VPWPHTLNRNVFNKRLNCSRLRHCLRLIGSEFHSHSIVKINISLSLLLALRRFLFVCWQDKPESCQRICLISLEINQLVSFGADSHHNLCPGIFYHCGLGTIFPSVLWHCRLGDRKGIRPVKKNWMLVCWWWWFDWSFARLRAPVVTSASVILCFNKQRLTQVHLENGR